MRWIRNIFALIAIVCVMIWVMSHYYGIRAGAPLSKPDSQIELNIRWGRVTVSTSYGRIPNQRWGWHSELQYLDKDAWRFNNKLMREAGGMDLPLPWEHPQFEYAPFSLADPAGRWTWSGTIFTFPLWLPTLLFGTWPTVALARHIKRRYFTTGICRKCGYDLRGSPSGICPECGRSSKPPRDKAPPSTVA